MLVLKGRKLNGTAQLVTPGAPITPPTTGGGGGGTVTPPPVTTPPPVVITGGSSAPLTSLNASDQRRVFNRDVYTGNPPGFSTTYNKGWASIPVVVTSNTTSAGLWMRLHNALDAAAQQTVPGSGAVLQPAVAVAGVTGLTVGTNNVNILVPAALARYYVDIAPDAAMTNPSRIPIAFMVGAAFGVGPGTSHGAAFTTTWAYDSTGATVPPISQMVDISPFGVVYAPNLVPAGQSTWDLPGDVGVSPYPTTGAAEFLRLCCKQLGVACAMVGFMEKGGNSFGWANVYDSRTDHAYGHLAANLRRPGKYEGQLSLCGANDQGVPGTRGELYVNMKRILDSFRALNSNPTPFDVVAATPLFDDGSASGNWREYHLAERDLEMTRSATVNDEWYDVGGAGINNVGSHSTMQGRMRMLRHYYRLAMGLMGPAKGGFALRRGPSITSATRSGTTITLHVTHDGATALNKVAWKETNSSTGLGYLDIDPATTTDSDLRYLFSVYPAGNNAWTVNQLALAATSVQIVDATTIRLFLASDPGAGVSLDVYHAMDFGQTTAGAGAVNVIICDNTDDGDGLNYGRPMRRTLDPVYVPAPTPVSQTLTLDQPLNPVSGAWLTLIGSGTGPTLQNTGTAFFATSIEVSVNGGAYAVPDGLLVRNDNGWSGYAQIPASIAPGTSITIAVRRAGTTGPDDTKTVTVTSARNELPDPDGTGAIRASCVGMWDAMNRSTIWQDLAQTTHTGHLQLVRVWQDALGDVSNDLKVWAGKTDPGYAGMVDLRKRAFGDRGNIKKHRPYIQVGSSAGPDSVPSRLIATASAAAAAITNDATIFFVLDNPTPGGGNAWFNVGYIPATGLPGGQNAYALGGQSSYSFVRTDPTHQASLTPSSGGIAGTVDYYVVRYKAATGAFTVTNRGNTVTGFATVATPAGLFNTIWLGGIFNGPQYGFCRIHQMAFFNRTLTDAEVASLQAWGQAKWPWN